MRQDSFLTKILTMKFINIKEASDIEDAEDYRYLVSTRSEGQEMLSESEQDDFERRMGTGKYR